MNDTEDKVISILILVVLYKVPGRANSYDLGRILEWKFHYFDIGRRIMLQLEKDGYICITTEFPVYRYRLEEKGRIYIKQHIADFRDRLFAEFPEQTELLTSLLNDKANWE